ncbi:hypothetical protein SLS62_004080 [Diatrype stigma]|uniref:Endonuclease/exonuclease/phosphatase domain-containing protein n=1 Tax=Diatrype stigma TaxID=117547 RepID=A0AAN9YQW3_9PEZI
MHFLPLLTVALSTVSFAIPSGASTLEKPQRLSGSISLQEGDLLTFNYSTDSSDSSNWIGVYYSSGGGPVNQAHVADCPTWEYAPGTEGQVEISIDPLRSGRYTVFYLASDGYEWLAEPIEISLSIGSGPLSFVVDDVTLGNARQGDPFEARVGGLAIGANATVEFSKTAGDGWIEISSNGTVSGTPPEASGEQGVATVRASASDGSTADLSVTIPIRDAGSPIVDELRVLSFNLWHGGSQVKNYHEKQVRFLLENNIDVAGLEEANDPDTRRIAEGVGYYYWQSAASTGVISRFPITEVYEELSNSGGVHVAVDGDSLQLNLWVVHLGYTPYGPYDFCYDQMTVEEVIEREGESGRTQQMADTLNAMAEQLDAASTVPVVLLGDTNAPSHLDWIEELREKNCGYADVPWPTSKQPIDAGLTDSFREAHPDPASVQGTTWSPLFPFHDGTTGEKEPQDRIDFIYYTGDLTVVESSDLVVGNPQPSPNHGNNEWTSDHRALLTVFGF